MIGTVVCLFGSLQCKMKMKVGEGVGGGGGEAQITYCSKQPNDHDFLRDLFLHDLRVTAAKLMRFTAVLTITYRFMEDIEKNYFIKFNGHFNGKHCPS